MRYTPAAMALALLVAVSASTGYSAPQVPLDPRAAALVAEGRKALTEGNVDAAVDSLVQGRKRPLVQAGDVILQGSLVVCRREYVDLIREVHDAGTFWTAQLTKSTSVCGSPMSTSPMLWMMGELMWSRSLSWTT